jgi:mannose-6-phosphate isomerase-like protein (cupin superfamily)
VTSALNQTVLDCDELEAEIRRLEVDGYRLDMIMPADAPTTALLSKNGSSIRLVAKRRDEPAVTDVWVRGRAGMDYRDLIPSRLEGKLIASHIRITEGGPVADYVHYHKAGFQMIYCMAGRIRVVYEDQGPPFWLETGDCVLQPPLIRHQVLECSAGSEVIEVSSPAVHETWIDHDISLPTLTHISDRDFSEQRFVRHVGAASPWGESGFEGFEKQNTGIGAATGGNVNVSIIRPIGAEYDAPPVLNDPLTFCFTVNDSRHLIAELSTTLF